MLKSDFEEILREIDSLNSKFTEYVAALKSEITIELNNRKSEMREQSKRIDLLVQEINHDMVVKMSDVRTNIEAMKMGITQNIVCKCSITYFMSIYRGYYRGCHRDVQYFNAFGLAHTDP